MAEDLRQLEEKAEELERKIEDLERELRHANGNVKVLMAVIGLVADKYPDDLAGQYLRECANLGLTVDLMKKESSALRYLARVMSGETFERLVAICAENAEADAEREFEMPDTTAAHSEAVDAIARDDRAAAQEVTGAADAK